MTGRCDVCGRENGLADTVCAGCGAVRRYGRCGACRSQTWAWTLSEADLAPCKQCGAATQVAVPTSNRWAGLAVLLVLLLLLGGCGLLVLG